MADIDDREYHKTAPPPGTVRPSIYECREPGIDLGAFLDEHLPALRGSRVPLLRAGFDDITLVELTDTELVVPDPEQIVDEIERNRYLYEPGLRPGVSWAAFVDGVRRDAREVVARDGAFRMTENHGLFTCR